MLKIHAVKFRSWRAGQTSYSTAVLGSVAPQEQANSIAEGSAAAQQRPQGPHQPKNFQEKGETRSFKKVWFEQWLCHGSTTGRLHVMFSGWKADRNNLMFLVILLSSIKKLYALLPIHFSLHLTNTGVTATPPCGGWES